MVPPIIETEEQLADFRFLPIKPIARIALTPGNLDDLIVTLEDARRAFEEFTEGRVAAVRRAETFSDPQDAIRHLLSDD